MTSMDRQSPQMEAAFRMLQRVWVIKLPVVEQEGEGEEEECYCQTLVVALRWAGARFGNSPSEVVVAVPAEAAVEYEDALQVPVYAPGVSTPEGECGVVLLVLPGSTVWERLVETVPMATNCLFFSEEPHNAVPRSHELAAFFDYPAEFATGLVVRLVGEETGEVMLSVHRHGLREDGSGEEAFHSTAELPDEYDPRTVLQTRKVKGSMNIPARKALLGPQAPPSAKELGEQVRGTGAKAKKAAAKQGPGQGQAQVDPLLLLTEAVNTLGERLSRLEASAQAPAVESASVNKGQGQAGPAGSLLSPGRVSAEGGAAVLHARGVLQGLPPPEREATTKGGRGRSTDAAYKALADGTPGDAQAAVQLATLEALEKILRRHSTGDDPLAELAEEEDFESGLAKMSGGARGAYAMMRVNRSIEAAPQRWSQLCDDAMAKALGSHISGLPWSASLYAQQRI
eukprot:6491608-Amphidinium_carterae.1